LLAKPVEPRVAVPWVPVARVVREVLTDDDEAEDPEVGVVDAVDGVEV
jgi:hypothetical protein